MKPKFLKLRNFKSIGGEPQTIDFAPITLLFGPNSAGKSTVLQSLIYLQEVLGSRNYDADKTKLGGDWLDLGGFRNLIHGRQYRDEALEISIGFALEGDTLPDYLSDHERSRLEAAGYELPEAWLGQADDLSVTLSIRWSDTRGETGQPYVDACESWVNGQRLARLASTPDGRQVYLEKLDTTHPIFDGVAVTPDDDSTQANFSDRFSSLISPSVSTRAADALSGLLSEARPFSDKTLDELEELVDGTARGQIWLLDKILGEVSLRTSRRAADLARRIRTAMDAGEADALLGYLGVTGQPDALPDPRVGLMLDSSVWAEESEENGEDADVFRLLSESLIAGFVTGPLQLLQNWLESVTYIGPLRDLPARNLRPQRTPDRSRWAKGIAAWEFLHQANRDQVAEINYWLGAECLKTGYQAVVQRYRKLPIDSPVLTYLDREMDLDQQLTLKELIEELDVETRVTLREEESGLEVMPQDIGVGISQLFPVVAVAVLQETGLIAIEQPELHVHPAIQVELADLFARYALKHEKLILLETHSEHVMLRLLRRIREQPEQEQDETKGARQLNQDSVSVEYVQSTSDGTKFKRLRIDETGDFLDEWPEGFFDERDQELFF